ncbi:tetratricopeptide repeat protein [Paremcibacter congregatus]|uniref:tetratricopeptide repeat protein n=1 Tax=Paremcibacter congregatus TaxID=2043170 RepID=UPI003A8ECFDF
MQLQKAMGRRQMRCAVKMVALSGVCLMMMSCQEGGPEPLVFSEPPFAKQTTLIGTPLRAPAWSEATKARLLLDLEIAQAAFDLAPDREESYIWLGRRYGYLGQYLTAIEIFSQGLEKFPDSYKLLRFRGRHLARTRQFERALADYRQAILLMADHPDSFEPDGIPNALGLTIGTYHTNIHYYLGQTSFAVGDYETMLVEMDQALTSPVLFARDDYLVSNGYWRYMALRKLGQHEAAEAMINAIPQQLDLIENTHYHKGVLLLQGYITEEDARKDSQALVKFALSMKYHFDGQAAKAAELQKEIIQDSPFGFWPAEVELVRSQN